MSKSTRPIRNGKRRPHANAVPSEAVNKLFVGDQAQTYKECHLWSLTEQERRPWRESSSTVLSSLQVTCCGRFGEAWGHWWERKDFSEGVLIYCVDGKGHCRHDGRECQITAGDLLYCPPNTHHCYWADPVQPWTIFWLHLCGTQLRFYERLLGLDRPDWVRHIGVNDGLVDDFTRLVVSHPQTGSESDWFCIQAMAIAVLGRISAVPQEIAGIATAYGPVQRAIALMKASLDQPFDLELFAQEAGCGRRHFIRQFIQVTGLPPGKWFARQRMRRACSLLALPNLRVKDVAAHLNYPDPLYFSRVFKRVMGISPEQYQKSPESTSIP